MKVGDKKRVGNVNYWVYQVHADGSYNAACGQDLATMLAAGLQREQELRAELSTLKRPAKATHNGEVLR